MYAPGRSACVSSHRTLGRFRFLKVKTKLICQRNGKESEKVIEFTRRKGVADGGHVGGHVSL